MIAWQALYPLIVVVIIITPVPFLFPLMLYQASGTGVAYLKTPPRIPRFIQALLFEGKQHGKDLQGRKVALETGPLKRQREYSWSIPPREVSWGLEVNSI